MSDDFEESMKAVTEKGRQDFNEFLTIKGREKLTAIADLTAAERRIAGIKKDDSPEMILLRKWIHWFLTANEAPRKMPNALHMETIVHIMDHDEEKYYRERRGK